MAATPRSDSGGARLLQPARNPVSTPHGVVYDREAILHYLLERKVQLRADKEEYDAQEARKAARAAEEEKGKQARQAEAMRKKLMGGIGDGDGLRSSHSGAGAGGSSTRPASSTGVGSAASSQLKARSEEEVRNRILAHGRDTETLEDKRKRLAQTNFWMPEVYNPDAGPRQLTAPDACPRCPITGKFLRSKQLYAIQFTRDASVTFGSRTLCAACPEAITHQKATLLRNCGCVIL